MSSTVAKALSLLAHFSEAEPEFGLSALARRAAVDKATVHRMLVVLAAAGLVEQNSHTKLYRIGAGVLRLARIREAAFPVSAVVEPALAHLTEVTGETAHASLISGSSLGTIGICPSPKSNRVSLEAGEALSLHGTASGIVFLAFCAPDIAQRSLAAKLPRHTRHTDTNPNRLRERIALARQKGFAEADQTYEDEVYGIAAPLFDAAGVATGAIAVATPCHRMTPALRKTIIRQLRDAAIGVTRAMGGEPPAAYLECMKRQAA